jgi:hypothetical protein
MRMLIGRSASDEIRGLVGLDLTFEQRIQLLREIEKRDPDRLRRSEREKERVLLGQRHTHQALTFDQRQKVWVARQFEQSDSLSSRSERLGWLVASMLFVFWHLAPLCWKRRA